MGFFSSPILQDSAGDNVGGVDVPMEGTLAKIGRMLGVFHTSDYGQGRLYWCLFCVFSPLRSESPEVRGASLRHSLQLSLRLQVARRRAALPHVRY